jgi:hypothetical protein
MARHRDRPAAPLLLPLSSPNDHEPAAQRSTTSIPGREPPRSNWGRSGPGGPARRRPDTARTARPAAAETRSRHDGRQAGGPAAGAGRRRPGERHWEPDGRPHRERRSRDRASVSRGHEARRTGQGRPEGPLSKANDRLLDCPARVRQRDACLSATKGPVYEMVTEESRALWRMSRGTGEPMAACAPGWRVAGPGARGRGYRWGKTTRGSHLTRELRSRKCQGCWSTPRSPSRRRGGRP